MANEFPRDEGCIFCKIVAGEIPSEKVLESESAIAIRDINPAAPMHLLVIPKYHAENVADLADANTVLAGELVLLAREAAQKDGNNEYRLIFNNGATAGQSVFHAHGHVIGGKPLSWNPA